MNKGHSGISKAYARSVVAVLMLTTWGLSALTGFLLWAAPTGQHSGRILLLFGLNKREWGDYHSWFSLAALIITVIHLTVDWKALRGCVNYLTRIKREGPTR